MNSTATPAAPDAVVVRCADCNRPMAYRDRDGKTVPGCLRRRTPTKCHACTDRTVNKRTVGRLLLPRDGIIDLVAVRRAAAGDKRVLITRDELVHAVHLHAGRGIGDEASAEILDVSYRAVNRMRREALPAGDATVA